MKINKWLIIITTLLVIVAVILITLRSKSTLNRELKDFAVEDTTAITRVFITDKRNNSVDLVRQADGSWKLNSRYTARPENVQTLLKTIAKIKVYDPVPRAARNNVIARLAAIGRKVEIYQKVFTIDIWGIQLFPREKKVKTYYIGDHTSRLLGTYALIEGSEEPFITHIPGFKGYLTTRYSPIEADWRNTGIFETGIMDILSVTSVNYMNSNESYRVDYLGDGRFNLFRLSNSSLINNADTLKVLDFLTSFKQIHLSNYMSDFPKEKKDSVLQSPPIYDIILKNRNNSSKKVTIWRIKAYPGEVDVFGNPVDYNRDLLYCLIDDKEFVQVQTFVFDRILKTASYFCQPAEES